MTSGLPAKVSKELANAAYDDFKRKAIDEAKKRAVAQRVDYDTFRNMVLTAHLKPINAGGRLASDRPLPCWSFGADGTTTSNHAISQPQLLLPSGTISVPSTSGDFYRDWRRNSSNPDDRYRYLKLCGPDTLQSLFRVEVSAEVLREVLAVLQECWLGHAGAAEAQEEGAGGDQDEGGAGAALREAAFVVRVLQALSAAGRFSLTVKLLGSAAKTVLQRLFEGLDAAAAAAAAAEEPGPVQQPASETQQQGAMAAPTGHEAAAADGKPGREAATAAEGAETPARALPTVAEAAAVTEQASKGNERGGPGRGSNAELAGGGDEEGMGVAASDWQMCSAAELEVLRRAYGLA